MDQSLVYILAGQWGEPAALFWSALVSQCVCLFVFVTMLLAPWHSILTDFYHAPCTVHSCTFTLPRKLFTSITLAG